MKKLTALALVALFATNVQAAKVNTPIGVVEAETLAITTAGVFVTMAVVSNGRGTDLPDTPPTYIEKCDTGDTLSGGLCYKNQGTQVVVVGSGTGTATTTITVPVVTTYKPIVTPVNS